MSGIDHLLQRLRKQREEGGLRRDRGGGQGDGQAARFLVTKQSWRGSYRRLLCITPTHIVTVSSTEDSNDGRRRSSANIGQRPLPQAPEQATSACLAPP
jgi:hypothetical protein